MSRPLHKGPVAAAALAQMQGCHADIIKACEAAVSSNNVVVIGMAQNPHVKNVRKALDNAKIPHEYLEYGSYFAGWDKRVAIKMWSGWPTFPQVFVKGELIGGEDLTVEAIGKGLLADYVSK